MSTFQLTFGFKHFKEIYLDIADDDEKSLFRKNLHSKLNDIIHLFNTQLNEGKHISSEDLVRDNDYFLQLFEYGLDARTITKFTFFLDITQLIIPEKTFFELLYKEIIARIEIEELEMGYRKMIDEHFQNEITIIKPKKDTRYGHFFHPGQKTNSNSNRRKNNVQERTQQP